ncbi:MAG: hypothetical protein Q4C96_09695, partial [Planctomycetia bacterium]|nr:hypothetical protein [Planctomycetia bacterium]
HSVIYPGLRTSSFVHGSTGNQNVAESHSVIYPGLRTSSFVHGSGGGQGRGEWKFKVETVWNACPVLGETHGGNFYIF